MNKFKITITSETTMSLAELADFYNKKWIYGNVITPRYQEIDPKRIIAIEYIGDTNE